MDSLNACVKSQDGSITLMRLYFRGCCHNFRAKPTGISYDAEIQKTLQLRRCLIRTCKRPCPTQGHGPGPGAQAQPEAKAGCHLPGSGRRPQRLPAGAGRRSRSAVRRAARRRTPSRPLRGPHPPPGRPRTRRLRRQRRLRRGWRKRPLRAGAHGFPAPL